MIDIISSMVLGGVILMIVLNANVVIVENNSIFSGDLLVQQLLISTTQIVESEFRNMGYRVDGDSLIIQKAESTAVWFLTGNPYTASIDTIKYFILTPESVAVNDAYVQNTQNELDRFLYRQKNNESSWGVGVVTFYRLRYYALKSETDSVLKELVFPISMNDMSRITAVEIELEVQNPYALFKRTDDPTYDERNALFSSSMWRQTRLTSQNLRK
jgi:hypothetical protein